MVSIILPVRDAERSLPRALRSVSAQSFPDWRLIAINDGSRDRSGDLLDQAARLDPRVRVLHTSPLGIARALQAGCETATTEWIARFDADDEMHPQRLAAQLAFAARNPALGVVSSLVRYGGDSPGYAAHIDWLNSLTSPEEIALRRFVESPVAHPSVLFRRELIARHGGYLDGDFPEDYELWLRWMKAGVAFGKVPEVLLTWHDPPDRLSRTDPRYAVERFYATKCAYLAAWLEAEVPPDRDLWLWGAGRVTRRRFDSLEQAGHPFTGFIDIDPKKAGRHRDGRPVRMADDLPPKEKSFLIVGVGNRGARELIHQHLTRSGCLEGRDFIHAA